MLPLNANNITAWYLNNGKMESFGNTYGLRFPYNTVNVVFSSGLLWGGTLTDGAVNELRVNGQVYSSTMMPGKILGERTGQFEDSTSGNRIWKVRRDIAVADLSREVDEYNHWTSAAASADSVTEDLLRNRYIDDWKDWPAEKGAPFYDADGDGTYTPKFEMNSGREVPVVYPHADEPGYAGADQVIWFVCHDLARNSLWKSVPLGLEEQVTIFAYNDASNSALGNSLFKRIKFVFQGTAAMSDSAKLKNMYVAHWVDPDMGDFGDDFAGCDTVLNSGFVYNSKSDDAEFEKYHLSPPALGYVLLQGPVVPAANDDSAKINFVYRYGYRNVQMTSFFHTASGGMYSDPPYNVPGAVQYYNLLNGYPPTPEGPPFPPLMTDPVSGQRTKFWSSGDPVTHSGWVDGILDVPGDRRIFLSSGPFTMSLGDTQEIVYAVVGGFGSTSVSSVSVMKYYIRQAHEYFASMENIPHEKKPEEPESPMPEYFSLFQNYPNPFNLSTTINYQLPESRHVTLKVYDILGKEIATLVDGKQSAGTHSVTFNASRLASGIYLFKFSSGSFVQTKKMVLLK